MNPYASKAGGRIYPYYKCSRLLRFGKDGCSPDRVRTNHRAEEVEQRVWEFVSDLMKDPERLREDLERMIELEKKASRGDPDREAKAWFDKLTEVETERRGYIKLAAKGHISEAELEVELAELDETCKTAQSELALIQNRKEIIEQLERDKEALLEHYANIAPEALDSLTAEERHQLYKMLRLSVVIRPDTNLEVSGVFGEGVPLSNGEFILVDHEPLHNRVWWGRQGLRDGRVPVLDSAQRGIDHPHKRRSYPDLPPGFGPWPRHEPLN
jgi:hypothetical protein